MLKWGKWGNAAQISKPKINWKEKFRKRKHKKLISKMEKLRDMKEISKYMVESLEKEMEMIKATVETNSHQSGPPMDQQLPTVERSEMPHCWTAKSSEGGPFGGEPTATNDQNQDLPLPPGWTPLSTKCGATTLLPQWKEMDQQASVSEVEPEEVLQNTRIVSKGDLKSELKREDF